MVSPWRTGSCESSFAPTRPNCVNGRRATTEIGTSPSFVHHLDYTLLRLPDSFHTEGFFKRESSLFRQLVPDPATESPTRPQEAT
jgi:hypothetical protein